MKKLHVLMLASVLGLSACHHYKSSNSSVILLEAELPTQLTEKLVTTTNNYQIKQGGVLEYNYLSNSSTFGGFVTHTITDKNIITDLGESFVSLCKEPEMIGCGSTVTIKFKAINTGSTTIILKKTQGDLVAQHTFKINIE